MPPPSQILNIIHFNDVYKMTETGTTEKGKQLPIIDDKGLTNGSFDHVVAFAERIKEIRNGWPKKPNGGQYLEPQGLLLFSGDLFSASVESVLTKGMNMVLLMNELAPDACVPGNHEFDFGIPRFTQLVEFCNFPWILSNVEEKAVDGWKLPTGVVESVTLERAGLKIGLIGLMSQDAWNKTNPRSFKDMRLNDMKSICLTLSKKLREEGCDLVFALTHAEHKEDLELAIQVGAYPADCPTLTNANEKLEDKMGVDAIFGGHNHGYYLGKGVNLVNPTNPVVVETDPAGIATGEKEFDSDAKYNDLLVVKSGYDFHDLSQVIIEIEDRPGQYRNKVITSLKVIRHNRPVDEFRSQNFQRESSMFNVLSRQFNKDIMKSLSAPVAEAVNQVEVDSEATRKGETIIGNWIADAMLTWYQKQEPDKKQDARAPLFIMTGGSIRGGITLGPGELTRHQIIQLIPFETTLTLLNVPGEILLEELNGVFKKNDKGIRKHFPVISGFTIEWNSGIEEGNPVEHVYLDDGKKTELKPDGEYLVLTNSYLADGGSGFSRFKDITPLSTFTEVAMYQALLFYINDLRAVEYQKSLERLKEQNDQTNRELDSIIDLVKQLLEVEDDRYGSLEKAVKHVALWALESSPASSPLPRITFSTELGRVKDLAPK